MNQQGANAIVEGSKNALGFAILLGGVRVRNPNSNYPTLPGSIHSYFWMNFRCTDLGATVFGSTVAPKEVVA